VILSFPNTFDSVRTNVRRASYCVRVLQLGRRDFSSRQHSHTFRARSALALANCSYVFFKKSNSRDFSLSILIPSTYLYAFSETLILPGTPVVSVRLVRFTVLPNKQYRGIRCPITPVTTSPLWMPMVMRCGHTRRTVKIVDPHRTVLSRGTYDRHAVHHDRVTEVHHVQGQTGDAPHVVLARFRQSADRHVLVAHRLHLRHARNDNERVLIRGRRNGVRSELGSPWRALNAVHTVTGFYALCARLYPSQSRFVFCRRRTLQKQFAYGRYIDEYVSVVDKNEENIAFVLF